MSDEFIKVATKEIQEDIHELEKTLSTCDSDDDLILNASKFQKHTHKIKGLAPMMGNDALGNLASLLDSVFKKIPTRSNVDGVLEILIGIIPSMTFLLNEPDSDIDKVVERITLIEKILN
ncbi:MAG: Hpt domain-containing protein [Nitrosopumilus sp.]|nr:Hpt domain-containing protein [Nitrosopumilus sp.]